MFNPFFPEKLEKFKTFHDYDKPITIQYINDFFVIYERFIGNYVELKEKWYSFMEAYKTIMNKSTILIEKFYNDPKVTGLNQCICDLCMTVDGIQETDNTATIKGGKFSVYRYNGKIQDIFRILQGIFSVWLPDSGYEMNQRYGLNIYRQIEKNNECVVMDLCIPIK